MVLREYLAREQLSVADFAAAIAIDPWSLQRYLNGQRMPTEAVLERIAIATKWQVLPNDFYSFAHGRGCGCHQLAAAAP